MDTVSYLSSYLRKYVSGECLETVVQFLSQGLISKTEYELLEQKYELLRERKELQVKENTAHFVTADSMIKKLREDIDNLMNKESLQLKWLDKQNQVIREKQARINELEGRTSDDGPAPLDGDSDDAMRTTIKTLGVSLERKERELIEAKHAQEEANKNVITLQSKITLICDLAKEGRRDTQLVREQLQREQLKVQESELKIKELEDEKCSLKLQLRMVEAEKLHVRRIRETRDTIGRAHIVLPAIGGALGFSAANTDRKCAAADCDSVLVMPIYCQACVDRKCYK